MPITKFFRRGVTKVWFLPAVANLAAPTAAEFTAGDDVTPGLQSLAGFTSANQAIDTPDADVPFTSNIPGEDRPEASSLTYYEDAATVDAYRALFTEGTTGFIVICPKGKATGKPAEVWPVRVSAANRTIDFSNVAALEVFQFAITDAPEKDAVLPSFA